MATISTPASLCCPRCGSIRLNCDGHDRNDQQRYLCKNCGFRPSALSCKNVFNGQNNLASLPQICAPKSVKNLEPQTKIIQRLAGKPTFEDKIQQYAVYSRNKGLAESTIQPRLRILKILRKRGANLYAPETVKEAIAIQNKWCNGRKNNAVDAYQVFLDMVGGKWERPVYKPTSKPVFLPKEAELNTLIDGSNLRLATFLQILKDTGARRGEIWWLKWSDIDFQTKKISITPEKGSNPRICPLTSQSENMLLKLGKLYGDRIFSTPDMDIENFAVTFQRTRKRLALRNERLNKIHFHTFRHWKGTMLYHETKDLLFVKRRLGHKSLKNTEIYIQLEEEYFDAETSYISKVAQNTKECCKLIDDGWEYHTGTFDDGGKIFRKRKTS